MITSTSLKHPTIIKKILRAMRNAQKWGIDHVENKKGENILAVRYKQGQFLITNKDNQSIFRQLSDAVLNMGYSESYRPSLGRLIVDRVAVSSWGFREGIVS